jgi:hypothetical protein
MTEERIKELRALAEVATPGPWHAVPNKHVVHAAQDGRVWAERAVVISKHHHSRTQEPADLAFIAAARAALPEALDEIEKLRGLLEETVASVVLDAARSRDTGDTVSAVECEDIAMRIRDALRGGK